MTEITPAEADLREDIEINENEIKEIQDSIKSISGLGSLESVDSSVFYGASVFDSSAMSPLSEASAVS